jgi:3-hydroxyisobutyrate dehydrogenase-like beta-hydroxyacid dehydrogenase
MRIGTLCSPIGTGMGSGPSHYYKQKERKIMLEKKDKMIGFIGLGTMGLPIATRILKSGNSICVYDIDKDRVDRMLAKGASTARNCKEIASNSDVIMSIVPDVKNVEEVMFGENGVIEGARRGQVIVEMSTVSPDTVKKIWHAASRKGVDVMDAAVCRTPVHAERGELMLLVGGQKTVIQEQKNVFNCIANEIVHCGDIGSGVTMKLINNMCVQNICMAVNESLALGVKSKLDLKQMISVLSSTAASNKVMEELYPGSLFINDFSIGFSLNLAHKDVGHALKLAAEKAVPCPVAAITHQWQSIARSKGMGNKDHSSLATVVENMVDIRLRV